MRRRDLILALGGAAAWPLAARAQPEQKVRRIGVLSADAEHDPDSERRLTVLRQRLVELGWKVGRNLQIEHRFAAADPDRMRAYAAELVGLKPDLIFASGTPTTAALQRQTRTIPIVFVIVADPIGSGLVTSLAHPGGNITGFSNIEPSMGGKWVELLKEAAPRVHRVALLFNPATAPYAENYLRPFELAGRSLAVETKAARVHDGAEIAGVMESLARKPDGGLIVLNDSFNYFHREQIISLATRHRVPTVGFTRIIAVDGGLISYGLDYADIYQRAAGYVDRILRGERPGDLPTQAPAKFELVVNLNTAKALGLEIPSTLLARADEVIE
jgi:putative ABC transport system substrate-binding protein